MRADGVISAEIKKWKRADGKIRREMKGTLLGLGGRVSVLTAD